MFKAPVQDLQTAREKKTITHVSSESRDFLKGILFEGVDRCGKTTQANRLVAHLKKERPVEFMRFPGRLLRPIRLQARG